MTEEKRPFLSVVTRTYKRPRLIRQCIAILREQTDHDFEHIVKEDEIGLGSDGAARLLWETADEVHGEYVYLCDDDDLIIDRDLVANLKTIANDGDPDVVMVKVEHAPGLVLPLDWRAPPKRHGIGGSGVIVKRQLFVDNIRQFATRQDGDFDYVEAVYRAADNVYWYDRVVLQCQQRGNGNPEAAGDSLNILLIYPGASWSPFDIARGYEHAFRALGHQVTAFNYHTRYSFYKSMFDKERAVLLASEGVGLQVLDMTIDGLGKPDVIVNIMGSALHRRAWLQCYVLGIPMVVILTESPYMDDFQGEMLQKGYARLGFTNDKTSVIPLREASGVQVEYLPHSFSPAKHYPRQAPEQYQTDVFFWGTMWPERAALLNALDLTGYTALVGGTVFDDDEEIERTVIENDDMALYYAGTKIALNHNRRVKFGGGWIDGAYSLGPRAYEIAACGAFQLCDDSRPELHEVFDGSVPTYTDAEDLQYLIDYYLKHDAERQQRRQEALKRVQACSFVERAKHIVIPQILEVL